MKELKTKIKSIGLISLLYGIILIAPRIFIVENQWFRFFEQPITILIPTILFTLIYLKITNKDMKSFYEIRKIIFKEIVILTGITLLLPAITYYVGSLFEFYESTSVLTEDLSFLPKPSGDIFNGTIAFLNNLVFFAVFPGICEEILFRGSILGFMKVGKWEYLPSIVINGILFGVFHENIEQLFYTTVMGFILTSIVLKTKSLYSSIYVHTLYNALVSLPDMLSEEAIPIVGKISRFYENISHPISFIVSTIIIWKLIKVLEKLYKENNILIESNICTENLSEDK